MDGYVVVLVSGGLFVAMPLLLAIMYGLRIITKNTHTGETARAIARYHNNQNKSKEN